MKIYIAVSIHGTNCFIKATREVKHVRYDQVKYDPPTKFTLRGVDFFAAKKSSEGRAVKVFCPELAQPGTLSTAGNTARALNDPLLIYRVFVMFSRSGWKVDADSAAKFRQRHKLKIDSDWSMK